MQTATSGASIYYTTNGSTPTQSSTLYSGTMTLTSSATVKAKAFKSGYQSSAEASASFTVAAWTFCALENSLCNFSGTKEVRYGSNGVYVSQIFTNGVSLRQQRIRRPCCRVPQTVRIPRYKQPADRGHADDQPQWWKLYGFCVCDHADGNFWSLDLLHHGWVKLDSIIHALYWSDDLNEQRHVKAKAFKSGYISSAESSASFTIAAVPITAWTFCALKTRHATSPEPKRCATARRRVCLKYLPMVYPATTTYSATLFRVPQTVRIPRCKQPAFSFSLSNSGDQSVVAGSSVTNSIATTLVSGTSQAVSFSVSGLPSGATGFFSSTSCNPACSTVLNMATTGSTPAGNFPITISATGGGMTRTTAFTLSVTSALTAIPTVPSASSTGNVYYVAKTGSDSNSCAQAQSQSTPKLTIQAGIGCLSAGDTLFVRAGTYAELINTTKFTIPSGTAGKPITIQSQSRRDSNDCSESWCS